MSGRGGRFPLWRATSWAGILPLALAGHLVAGQAFVTLPVGPAAVQALGHPPTAGGWPTAAFALGYALASLAGGAVAVRFGRRRTVVSAALATSVVGLLVALSGSVGALVAGRLLEGLCAGAVMPLLYAEVADHPPTRARTVRLTVLSGAMASSVVVGQLVGSLAEELWGWRTALAVAAVAPVLAAGLARRAMRDDGPARPRPVRGTRQVVEGGPRRVAVRWPLLAPALLVAGLLTFLFAALERLAGDGPVSAGTRAAGLLGVLVAIGVQSRLSRISPTTRALGAVSLCAAASLSLEGPWGATPAVVTLMGALCVLGPATIELLHDRADGHGDRILARYGFALNVGGATGAAVGAHVTATAGLVGGILIACTAGALGLLADVRGRAQDSVGEPEARAVVTPG